MRRLYCWFLAAGALAAGADAPPKAATCVACHGENGVSANDLWPSLAGQKEGYLVKQLKAFHDGTRADPLMTPISKMLSDREIQELAAYYATLKGSP
jgi:cytochrome c553